ncbi:MAG: cytochrome c3 family protein, partial [Candidatus Omnitrophica bacterium]|nr:cytochrome c3 family protein [Candidatus Omnitrophota bacterium]
MKTSIHSQNGILCQDCHGGDPTKLDFELAKAPSTGFIGKPTKKQIVERCGECHGDVERMNFYGIRADQLVRYKTSVHGKKLLLAGDEKVAACTDCHGSHHVVSVSDTNSPVYPLNLPNTCNQCHGDKKLMDQYHLPSDVFQTYRASVHGRALFEKKDLSVANCASCHGSHGAVPPGVRHIGETCGKCHINEKKYFLESVHAPVMKEGKFSECISCHGNHGVKPA